MTPQSLQAVAISVLMMVGGFVALLSYDLVLELLKGHTATISHGWFNVGDTYPWFRGLWLVVLIGLTVFLYWHFWGWVRPW